MIEPFSPLVAVVATLFAIYLLRPLAIRVGLVDLPGGRKQHQGSIPLIGGLAMFAGFGFALLTLSISLSHYRSFIAAAALVVVTGILDDFHELSARDRALIQLLAALLITAWGGNMVQHLGNLLGFGTVDLGNWALPFTVFAIVAVINAINLMDGVDGLAGSMVLIQLTLLISIAMREQLWLDVQILILLIAVLLSFLLFNFPFPGRGQAKLFMGDAGSMFLGLALVWFLISLSQTGNQVVPPAAMLWIITLPLFDTLAVILRRLWRRQSPFKPDRQHIHHLLQMLGYSNLQITLLMSLLTLVCGLAGIIAISLAIPEYGIFASFLLGFMIYFIVVQRVWRTIPEQ